MRGGSSCSSAEISVMEMERRGCVNSMKTGVNWGIRRNPMGQSRFHPEKDVNKGWQEPYEARVSRTESVRSLRWNSSCLLGRPLVIGRKNWLFVGSENSGIAAGVILSLVQTCRFLKINPREYLEDILRRFMGHSFNKLYELLPDQWLKNKHLKKPP